MKLGRTQVLFCLLTAFAVTVPIGAMAGPVTESSEKQWTLMMYWDADNSLEFCTEFAMSTWEKALTDDSQINIVALIDILSEDGTWIYDIVDGKRHLMDTWEELNSSDPVTLERFVNYCMDEFPAENTMLVLQDHGYGWRGICQDETNGDTLMSLDGLATALENVKARGEGIDLLAFDACNMATLEVAYELRDVVSYVVGSETMVPFDGLPYKMFITDLVENPTLTPEELSLKIVAEYVLYYSSKKDYEHIKPYNQDFATIVALDMSKMGALGDAFDQFADALLPIIREHRKEIEQVRGYALIGNWANMAGYEWMPDVYTFIDGLRSVQGHPELSSAIDEFEMAFDAAVMSEAHSRRYKDTVHGLNFWFPPSLSQYNSQGWIWARQFIYHDVGLDIVAESSWYDCLMAYYEPSG